MQKTQTFPVYCGTQGSATPPSSQGVLSRMASMKANEEILSRGQGGWLRAQGSGVEGRGQDHELGAWSQSHWVAPCPARPGCLELAGGLGRPRRSRVNTALRGPPHLCPLWVLQRRRAPTPPRGATAWTGGVGPRAPVRVGSLGSRLAVPPRLAGPLGRARALLCSFRWPSTIVLLEIMNSIPIKGH